jgi:Eukaryotic aspartyl protease
MNIERRVTPRKPRPVPADFMSATLLLVKDRMKSYFLESILGAPAIDVDVFNDNNYSYYTDIYVGSNGQKFSVIVDTGSNKLILMSSTCKNCNAPRFVSA